ncbi:MAG: ATP-binding cassette domain-containing protein [Clostridia bacterium]|nr:ATP-binding cassette domain-containing protein [Clostridia bacterium]
MFSLKSVKYKDILDIEELFIPSGKVSCIVGESGSGKTTLIKLLNNLISPDAGIITYKETPLEDINPVELRRNVVMLPQSPPIFSGSIRDNLLMGLKFSEKPLAADEKLNAVLMNVKLEKALEENAEKLSGGEKQRLALARVLLLEPEVFLLDEPSSALDESTEDLIIDMLVSYSKAANKTLVMVTHSQKVARNFSDIIIEIKKGKVISKKEGIE